MKNKVSRPPFNKKYDNDISKHYVGSAPLDYAQEVLKDLPIGTKLELRGRPCNSVDNYIKISDNEIKRR